MSYICDICDKGTTTGTTQRHHRGVAGKRWKFRAPKTSRLIKPNLQNVTLLIGETKTKSKVCAKCLKRIKKFGSIKSLAHVAVA
jgi:ribosomal protein L28